MADISWIKLNIDMFDNRKIKHLRRLPDGNSIVLIWVMLLTMAGRTNNNGAIYLTENIPYTPKMLADELDFEEATISLALNALERFGMIEQLQDGVIMIPSWAEYQNIDGMEKVREQKRLAQQRWRDKQKMLKEATVDSTVDSTETSRGKTEEDKEGDIKKIDLSDRKKEEKEERNSPPSVCPSDKDPYQVFYEMYREAVLTGDTAKAMRLRQRAVDHGIIEPTQRVLVTR